jgi:hypothetical protein
MSDFVDQCLAGEVAAEEIDDFVTAWHEGDDGRPIHQFLGLTPEEYAVWVEQPASLRYILFSRRHGIDLEDALELADRQAVAARTANEGEARVVLDWLRRTGRIS